MISTEFFAHEDYDANTIANDIGLIKLPDLIEFNENIQPIGLSSKANIDGLEVTMSGWGKTSGHTWLSDVLRTFTVPVLPNRDCLKNYDTLRDTEVCIGSVVKPLKFLFNNGKTKTTCSGDSGSPLVLNGKAQVGIDSYRKGDCGYGFSTVFTWVSSYIDWIKKKIATF